MSALSENTHRPDAEIGQVMDWEPISEADLKENILAAESRMAPPIKRLWEAIRIVPEKWSEATFGTAGGGFWVVAVIGNRAIWFNDIEDGFNCSSYAVAGKLAEYFCNQDELELAVHHVLELIGCNDSKSFNMQAGDLIRLRAAAVVLKQAGQDGS